MVDTVSLFSGCGGSDAGVISAGFDVIMANDIFRYANDVYLANQPDTDYVLGNIEDINCFPNAELLIGPLCNSKSILQSASSLKRRQSLRVPHNTRQLSDFPGFCNARLTIFNRFKKPLR